MPQQGGCGSHASMVDAALRRFHCGARRMCAEQPTADDPAVLNDLLGRIDPYRVESSRFTPLVGRLLSFPAERHLSLSPGCWSPMVLTRWLIFIKSRRQISLLQLRQAPRFFLDRGIRRDRRLYLRTVRRMLDCGVLSLGLRHGCRHFRRPEEIGETAAGCGRPPRQSSLPCF